MTKLLHISDTHFGTEQPNVMAALLALSRQEKPDVLVVSGDITQRATHDQFSRAKAFCDSLGIAQTVSLPGNHDIPLFKLFARVLQPYAAYQRAFGQALEREFVTPWLCLATVNTTRWWRHKNGEVSKAQIERVCQHLARATPQQLRVVVVHQPIYVMRPQDEHDRLRGWQGAAHAWAAAGCDIVMGGHIHLPYVCDLSTTPDGPDRRIWCVQAGTAVSNRIRREAPNSVNLIEFDAGEENAQCTVQRWDYAMGGSSGQQASGRFALQHISALNLQRD